jgi:hypothetical protein
VEFYLGKIRPGQTHFATVPLQYWVFSLPASSCLQFAMHFSQHSLMVKGSGLAETDGAGIGEAELPGTGAAAMDGETTENAKATARLLNTKTLLVIFSAPFSGPAQLKALIGLGPTTPP